jgi:hypothetical protein
MTVCILIRMRKVHKIFGPWDKLRSLGFIHSFHLEKEMEQNQRKNILFLFKVEKQLPK